MSPRRNRMIEDRFLRDSARAVVEADIQHLRNDLSHKGVGARAFDRLREGAVDVYEEAVDVASDNRGALAALGAAILVWFARHPIFSALGFESDEPDEDADEDWY